MKEWHFNVLFFVGVGGAVLLLVGPQIGLHSISKSPTAVTGVGSILAYVLTQKKKVLARNRRDEPTDPVQKGADDAEEP